MPRTDIYAFIFSVIGFIILTVVLFATSGQV